MIEFTIPGRPIPNARPRAWRGNVFTPAKQRAELKRIKLLAEAVMAGREPLEGPLHLSLQFTFPWPVSYKKSGTAYRPGRPDLDNLVKMASDGMNEVVWRDDAQIVDLRASKRYGEEPGVAVLVMPMERGNERNGAEMADAGGNRGD